MAGVNRFANVTRGNKWAYSGTTSGYTAPALLWQREMAKQAKYRTMPVTLYDLPLSPPCMSVRLLAKTLGIDLILKHTDLWKGEHLKPEFIKMNPQHAVPTLDDNGFYLWESRAILTYLCEAYGKDGSLYPEDPKKRALINQRLYFDSGTLWNRYAECVYPVVWKKLKDIPDDKRAKLKEAFEWLDGFIGDTFVAGDSLTVADFSAVAMVASMEAVGYDISPFKNVSRWLQNCKSTFPGYNDSDGTAAYKEFIVTKLSEEGVSL